MQLPFYCGCRTAECSSLLPRISNGLAGRHGHHLLVVVAAVVQEVELPGSGNQGTAHTVPVPITTLKKCSAGQ